MLAKTIAVFAAMLVLAGSGYLAVANEKDKRPLQGTWEFIKGDEKMKLVFNGDKFIFEMKGKTASGTYTLDPAKTPKTMDMLITEGSDADIQKYKGKTAKAIYEIDGTKLKWCSNEPGKEERPTALPDDPAKGKMLYVIFDRVKK